MNLDGMPRDPDEDRRISEAFLEIFKGKAGDKALAYLREVCHAVVPYNAEPLHFAYQEGMRYTLRLVESRIADGIEVAKGQSLRPAPPPPRKPPAKPRLRNWSQPE